LIGPSEPSVKIAQLLIIRQPVRRIVGFPPPLFFLDHQTNDPQR